MKKGYLSDQGMCDPEERLRFEELISDLSSHFMKLDRTEVGPEIEKALQKILEFFDVDRCALFKVSQIKKVVEILYLVDRPEQMPVPPDMDAVRLFPWCYDELVLKGNVLPIKVVEVLPEEANVDKASFESLGIRSILLLPLQVVGVVHYIISIASSMGRNKWQEECIPRLRLLGEVFVGALERNKNSLELEERFRFETLISGISARLIKVPHNKVDQEIERALQKMLEFFQVDRCGLLQTWGDRKTWMVAFAAYAEGVPRAPEKTELPMSLFPWVTRRLVERQEVNQLNTVDELPAEADIDKQTYREWGIRSTLDIPILMGGHTDYVLAINAMLHECAWPEDYIPRLRLLGEAFVNALERGRVEEEMNKARSEIEELNERLKVENVYLRKEASKQEVFNKIIEQSDAIRYVKYRVQQVAPTNATALIFGETGTGKGLFAHLIHELSGRKDKPFVTVGCAALPANLIESELFGREKGAFTGAQERQIGRFEFADGGTLFLDEIGELPLELQVKLLRVIEDGEFERLGSSQTRKVDVRLIAATNRNLEEEIRQGRFRQDLFFRLSVFPLTIPPLRQRRDDIPFLVKQYLEEFGRRHGKQNLAISEDAMKRLQEYSWPGNVRELLNVLERAVIISRGPMVQIDPLLQADPDSKLHAGRSEERPAVKTEKTPAATELAGVEREHILIMLKASGWKVEGANGAAAKLGMNPSTLRARIRKLGIKRPGA
ncbi:MAG: sigma 54-interacting transcriptional regulator [Nitrospiraceae bacterium]|nr:sigma 54-interacting transcriptional regulator [Nitrospiraceae bacterium]